MIRNCAHLIGLLVAVAAPATAQLPGLPVVNSGGASGLSVGADYGKANAHAGNGSSVGVHAGLGLGLVGVRVMGSRSEVSGKEQFASGATATIRLLGGPFIPFRVLLQGGVGRWKVGGMEVTRVPLSLGLGATIPNPAFAIKPWIAPRLDRTTTKVGGSSESDTEFAISGGIDLTLLNGLTLRGAYDRTFRDGIAPAILSFGLSITP